MEKSNEFTTKKRDAIELEKQTTLSKKEKITFELGTFNADKEINELTLSYKNLLLAYEDLLVNNPTTITAKSRTIKYLINNRELYAQRALTFRNDEQAIISYTAVLHYIKIHDLSKQNLLYKIKEAEINYCLGKLYQHSNTNFAIEYFIIARSIYESLCLNYDGNANKYRKYENHVFQLNNIIYVLQHNNISASSGENTDSPNTDSSKQGDGKSASFNPHWFNQTVEYENLLKTKEFVISQIIQLSKDIIQLRDKTGDNTIDQEILFDPKKTYSLKRLQELKIRYETQLQTAGENYVKILKDEITKLTEAIIKNKGNINQVDNQNYDYPSLIEQANALELKIVELRQQLTDLETEEFIPTLT